MCSRVLTSALPPCGSLGPVGRQKPQSKLNGGSLIQGIIASDKRITVRSRETLCGSLGLSERAQGRTNYQTFPPQWRKQSLARGTAGEFAGLARPELAQGFWTSHRPPSAVRVRRSWSAARHIGEQRSSGCWWGAGGLQSLGAKLGLWCPCPHGCRRLFPSQGFKGSEKPGSGLSLGHTSTVLTSILPAPVLETEESLFLPALALQPLCWENLMSHILQRRSA